MTDDGSAPTPPRRPGLPAMFWVMMVFGVVCVVAGYVVARHGPRLFPAPSAQINVDR